MDRKWRALIVVCVAIFMLLLDITVVNVALPDIQRELHTSFTDLQWVVDAYALMLATVMLNAGSIGDLLGRKRVFIAGIVLFTAASAACGAATSPLFLNLARGAQGIGGAIMFAVSLAILSQEFHGRERGTAFGIWGATIGAAVAIGPLVGGAITTWFGWRWIFFVNLPIGVLCAAGAWRELHESRNDEHGGFDLPGFATLTGGLFSLVLALLRGNDWHWGSGREVALFTAAGVLLAAFVLIEARQQTPMFDVSLFRVPTFTGAQIVAFAISAAMFSQFLYLTLYLQNVLGYSPIQAGLRFLPLSLLAFFVAPVAGRLSGHFPVRLLLGTGLGLVGLALLLMSRVTTHSGWTVLLPGFLIAGFGIGMVNPPLASTAVSIVEPRRAGMASGINNTFRQVGIATGIAALGAIFQSRIASELHGAGSAAAVASGAVRGEAARAAFVSGLHEILLVAAVVAFVGAALAFVLIRRRDFVLSGPTAAP
ncbi:MAG TPA: DHA2 family efflux MFS transporter permease subunit [Gaiellaceae bacterium]|nr:DHA2 family efflux MFS transporter permease subunit [Gaiellaceae bacterium]